MKIEKKAKFIASLSFVIVLISISAFQSTYAIESSPKAYLMLIWEEDQPFYGLKNVTDVPLLRILSLSAYLPISELSIKYGIKQAFVISPATILDVERELNGSLADKIYFLSEKLSLGKNLTAEEEYFLIMSPMGLFGPLSKKISQIWPRYSSYYLKYEKVLEKTNGMPKTMIEKELEKYFQKQQLLDLCSMYNLYWLGKNLAKEEGIEGLWEMGNYSPGEEGYVPFTSEDLKRILEADHYALAQIIEKWKELSSKGSEFIPTPYSCAILPILYDFGWNGDIREQVALGELIFSQFFQRNSTGIWLPGLAVNKEILQELASMGVKWTIIAPGKLGLNIYKPYYVQNGSKRIYLLIEDQELTNYFLQQLKFMSPEEAAESAIKEIEKEVENAQGGSIVLALPTSFLVNSFGSESWEFLSKFYSGLKSLEREGEISLVTPSEYLFKMGKALEASEVPSYHGVSRLDLKDAKLNSTYYYQELPVSVNETFPEYSQYGDLSSWIGYSPQNRAWVLLKELKSLLTEKYSKKAYLDLLKAESGYYFYYLGRAGQSPYSPYFDQIFKEYLVEGFHLLGRRGPEAIYAKCFPNGMPYYLSSPLKMRNGIQFVHVDGNLGEWKYYYLYRGVGTSLYISSDGFNLNLGIVSNDTPLYVFIGSCWYRPSSTFSPFGINARMGVEAVVNLKAKELLIPTKYGLKIASSVEVARRGNVTEVKVPLAPLGYRGPLKIYLEVYLNSSKTLFPYNGAAWYVLPIKVQKKIVAYFIDPSGDDHGPGTYVYPENPEIKKGDFDLLIFKVLDSEEYVIFNLTFRTLGGNPLEGPNGFSFQVVQIYVQIANGLGSKNALPGPNVRFKDFTWDFAIQAAGWPSYCYIQYYNGVKISDLEVTSTGNSILIYVPSYEIGHPQKNWKYAVLVGCLLRNSTSTGYWMPVKPHPGKWNFGGANLTAYEEGIVPRVIDMLDPGNQYSQLSSYNISSRSLAAVTGVSFPEHLITPTPTPTTTPRPTSSPRPTPTPKVGNEGRIWSYIGGIIAITIGAIIVTYVITRRRR